MGKLKWIVGILGFVAGGPLGALAGFVLGSLLEGRESENLPGEDASSPGAGRAGTDAGRGYARSGGQRVATGSRNSFLFSMMVLMSYVIGADGRIMHSEMEYARRFLRTNFGTAAETEGEAILKRLFELRKTATEEAWKEQIRKCCQQIRYAMAEEQRLQLIAILVEVAKSDGSVAEAEVQALRELADWLGVEAQSVDQLSGLGGETLEEAYRVLGLTPDATDEEVRKAYRQMALKYHPDRVQSLGEDVRKQAEETFKKINEAKERIDASRKGQPS